MLEREDYTEEVLRLSYNVIKARGALSDAENKIPDLKIAVKSSEQALDDLLKKEYLYEVDNIRDISSGG